MDMCSGDICIKKLMRSEKTYGTWIVLISIYVLMFFAQMYQVYWKGGCKSTHWSCDLGVLCIAVLVATR